MCQLIETIKVYNRSFQSIDYHNNRMNLSRKDLFGCDDFLYIQEKVTIPINLTEHAYRCRIVYKKNIEKAEFIPHIPRKVRSLKIVHVQQIDYSHKYLDRSIFDILLQLKDRCDDILIVKNGYVTDTSFSNILFYDGLNWYTPSAPLLKGTMRAQLLDKNRIQEAQIQIIDLSKYQKAMLINALNEFDEERVIPVCNIAQK